MHGVGVAEQVVQVAQDLLVRAGEEDAEDVGLALVHRMQLERRLPLPAAGEAVDHAVRVAGDVLQGPAPGGRSISRWIGMIGKSWSIAQLSGSDWKTREVAEVPVHQRGVDVGGDLGERSRSSPMAAGWR